MISDIANIKVIAKNFRTQEHNTLVLKVSVASTNHVIISSDNKDCIRLFPDFLHTGSSTNTINQVVELIKSDHSFIELLDIDNNFPEAMQLSEQSSELLRHMEGMRFKTETSRHATSFREATFDIEELYQVFKERLLAEMKYEQLNKQ